MSPGLLTMPWSAAPQSSARLPGNWSEPSKRKTVAEATWAGAVTGASLGNPILGVSENAASMVLGHAGDLNGPGAPGSELNQFSGNHGRGVNFVFADGHVKVFRLGYKQPSWDPNHDMNWFLQEKSNCDLGNDYDP